MEDPIHAVEARRDGADGIMESPFSEQRALIRREGLRCFDYFESVMASTGTEELEQTSRANAKAKTAAIDVVALRNGVYH